MHSGLPVGAAHDLPSALAAMHQGSGAPGGSARREARSRAVPTIVFHGDRDRVVHPSNGEAVAAQATAQAAGGLRTTTQPGRTDGGHAYNRTLHTDSSGRVLCELWTIHGAGHAWAGGSPSGSHTDPRGPDASEAMLRFFLDRRLTP